MIKFLRGAPGIAAGKSGDAPGQEEPELLSTALPIEIFGNTGAPAPRPLSRTASRAGNGAKEPENQGFFRSPEPKLGSLESFVASSQPERARAEERVSACLSRKTGAALCARCSGCRIPVHARLVTGNLTFGSGRAKSSGENESKERYKVFHDAVAFNWRPPETRYSRPHSFYASARPDVFASTGRPQPGRCSKIAPRLNDSGEAFPLVWKRTGRELAIAPPRLNRPNIRCVFTDVIGNGHCGSPKLGWS